MVHRNESGLSRTEVSGSEFEVVAPNSEEEVEKIGVSHNAFQRILSRLFLRVGCFLFYIACFQSYHWLIFYLFAGDAETIPGVSGNEDVSTGVETDGQLRGRHIVVTTSLVPLAGGPSMMSLRLSTVEVGASSCWSRCLMMVIFVFE